MFLLCVCSLLWLIFTQGTVLSETFLISTVAVECLEDVCVVFFRFCVRQEILGILAPKTSQPVSRVLVIMPRIIDMCVPFSRQMMGAYRAHRSTAVESGDYVVQQRLCI